MSESVQQRVSKVIPDAAGELKKDNLLFAIRHALFAHSPIHLSLLALILLYLGLAVAFSQVISFNKGPDEGVNLDYIEFIAGKGRLPITYAEREEVGPKANWPALYHLGVVGLSRMVKIDLAGPPMIKIFWDSFRYQAIDVQTENVSYLLAEDQEWPYYGRILVLHLGRWLSILFSMMTLLLVYLIALEFLPHQPWLALMAPASLAFIPMFIFMGSVLNEDALVAMLAALYFWLLVRAIKQPDQWWLYGAIGLVLGLSVTAKYTTIVLPLEVGVVLALITRQKGYEWGWWGQRIILVGGSAILASSWWFGWNLWFLNEVKQLGWIAGLLRPLFTGGTDVTLARLGNFFSGGQIGLADLPENTDAGTFAGWMYSTFLSFWAVNIGDAIPLWPYAYLVVGLIIGSAAIGLWRLWRQESSTRRWLLLLVFHTAIFIILPLVRFGLSRRLGQTAQGRHILIPAAAAIAILLVWGLAMTIPRRAQCWVFSLLLAGLLGWTGAHLYWLDTYAAPLLPLRTLPQAAEWFPHPVKAQFGDHVELVSYNLDPQPESGLLRLDLAWRSLVASNENYLVRVTLSNEAGQIVSYWLGYNGQGRLPTLAWVPGDVIFDRIALPLPNLPAGSYRLQVQLLSSTGPLAISNGEAVTSIVLTLTEFSLNQPTTLSFSQQLTAGSAEVAFAVWRVDGPAELTSSLASTSLLPIYRYPATISLLVSGKGLDDTELDLQLVDVTGQPWQAVQREADLYTFIIGPRWPSGDYRLQMTLQKDNQIIDQTLSEPLLTVVNWWERRFTVPEIAAPSEANFANQLKLLGYKLPKNQVKAGEAFPLTLYWQALLDKAPQADFIQFNNFLDSSGTLYGGYDRRPLEYYSTLLWAPGEVIIDGYAVLVEATAPPGEYYLNVGYYLTVGESAVNLPLVIDGQMSDISSITIGPIEVMPP